MNVNLIYSEMLQWSILSGGIASFRTTVDYILSLPSAFIEKTISLYEDVLTIELTQSLSNTKRIRALFESAVQEKFSSIETVGLWLKYVQFERKNGDYTKANQIQWRAKKTIKESNFVNMFDSQVNKL